jgi:hypothetical protein
MAVTKKKLVPATAPMAEACMSCRFYMMQEGVCRRYPPTQTVTAMYNKGGERVHDRMSLFPQMQPNGWCGEYQQLKVN